MQLDKERAIRLYDEAIGILSSAIDDDVPLTDAFHKRLVQIYKELQGVYTNSINPTTYTNPLYNDNNMENNPVYEDRDDDVAVANIPPQNAQKPAPIQRRQPPRNAAPKDLNEKRLVQRLWGNKAKK